MTKREYLDRLADALGGMSYAEVKDIKADIEAHFEAAMMNGKTEEEIAEGLGDPKELAAEFLDGADIKTVLKKTKKEMIADKLAETTDMVKSGKETEKSKTTASDGNVTHGRIFVVLFSIFVMIPVWLVYLIAILGISAITIAVAAFAGCFAFLIPSAGIYMVPAIFFELTIIALIVAAICLLILGIKYFFRGTKNYFGWTNKLWAEGF